jgi:acetolactate synthase-1/2/3 large subunit
MTMTLESNGAVADAAAMTGGAASVAEAFLQVLKDRGVDYFYIGAGTDTAPLIEAYARMPQSGLDFPEPIVAVHENLAVGMAHGYYMVSGRPQAVMLHVSVGAANAVCGLMNAARSQVPMLFMAGRTPLFESGRLGSRDNTIHWGQEMFDQAGMVREFMKWDYELRDGCNVAQILDRGLGISMAAPRGPVYLTLPREVLAQDIEPFSLPPATAIPAEPHPDPAEVRRLAQALMQAELPVIVCTGSGADPDTVAMLVELADRFGIAVGESKPRFVNFPTTHPLHVGFAIDAILAKADALLFLESDVPWLPGQAQPKQGAFVAHAACDPLFTRYPVRSFPSDLTLTTSIKALLPALIAALDELGATRDASSRAALASDFARAARTAIEARARADEVSGGPITKMFLTRCLDQVRSEDTIIVNEYSAIREQLTFDRPGTFFLHPNAGGLGWGLPAALGAQHAARDSVVIAVVGDGAYIFSNPSACHQASAMHDLPVLTVIFNNGGWDAVQKSALTMYPAASTAEHAARHKFAPLSSLHPLPDFEKYAEASGGYGERVTERSQLIPALRRAIEVVRTERRQALLNVIGA